MARVCTYLNFPGTTEKAFHFYQSIFGGEFIHGIVRFRDLPPSEGVASLIPETGKDLIVHIELPILGGHILMGSDAPESLGFKLITGNNIHIHLEPDTREETRRLFELLSSEGSIKMPLQDMFWGAYYGSCTDQYGIQWMFNCIEKE